MVHEDYEKNKLISLFVSSAGLRKPCFTCSFSKMHFSDITIGDVEFEDTAEKYGYSKYHLSTIAVNSNRGEKIFSEIKKYIDYALLNSTDEEYICHYYRSRIYSHEPWGYDPALRNWFSNEVNQFGFEYALDEHFVHKELFFLKDAEQYINGRPIYLYGCGVKGKRIKKVIEQYLHWPLLGFIETEKKNNEVDGLQVYSFDEFLQRDDSKTSFIIVTPEKKDAIYSVLDRAEFMKNKNYY